MFLSRWTNRSESLPGEMSVVRPVSPRAPLRLRIPAMPRSPTRRGDRGMQESSATRMAPDMSAPATMKQAAAGGTSVVPTTPSARSPRVRKGHEYPKPQATWSNASNANTPPVNRVVSLTRRTVLSSMAEQWAATGETRSELRRNGDRLHRWPSRRRRAGGPFIGYPARGGTLLTRPIPGDNPQAAEGFVSSTGTNVTRSLPRPMEIDRSSCLVFLGMPAHERGPAADPN